MNIDYNSVVGLILTWCVSVLVFFIRYKYPHFGMHFTSGIKMFTFQDLEFDKKCKIHTKLDIQKFKNRQGIILIIILITGPVLIITDIAIA